jgi:hypothetical protein
MCKRCKKNEYCKQYRKTVKDNKPKIVKLEKQCSTCGEIKPIDLFLKGKNMCKSCKNIYNKKYINKDRAKEWRNDNKDTLNKKREKKLIIILN